MSGKAAETSTTYSSTRGGQKNLDFRSAVMTGLAHDRGLFVPDSLPEVTPEDLEAWKSLSYKELAVEVIRKFVKEDQVPYEKLKDIVGRSCDAFRSEDVTPLVEVGGHIILVSSVIVRMLFKKSKSSRRVMRTPDHGSVSAKQRTLAFAFALVICLHLMPVFSHLGYVCRNGMIYFTGTLSWSYFCI